MIEDHIFAGAVFAVPGRLDTPTGGYEYARQLIVRAKARHLPLIHWPLPALRLTPDGNLADPAVLGDVTARLAAAPAGWPVLIDGLAFGVLPPDLVASLPARVAALVHHPLAQETGLSAEAAAALRESERAALTAAEAVVATSAHTAETLSASYGVAPARVTVARPGTPRPDITADGRAILPASGASIRLLSVGSLVPRKGHDVLLEALATLVQYPWHLTIIGSAERDPATAAALAEQAATLRIADRVHFAADASRAEIDRALADADIFVLASHHEGYGMAYAEAVAAGLPVVGTKAGAVAEATRGAAVLVPPGNPTALSAALAPLLASADARASLAAASKAAAPGLPGWDDALDAVLAAIAPLQGAKHPVVH